MSEEKYYQKHRDVILKRAKDYYENDKERLRKQVKKYRELSEKEKKYKIEHGRSSYLNMSKEKKRTPKEYQKYYCEPHKSR